MRLSSKASLAVTVFLAVTHSTAYAQGTDPVPLRNWPAPLSWQATTHEELASANRIAMGTTPNPALSVPGSSTSLGVLVSITPCRLVDTRGNMPIPYGAGPTYPLTWTPGSTHTIPASGLPAGSYVTANPCVGLPVAQAYSTNITVLPQTPVTTANKWLSVCPTGTATATCAATVMLTWYQGGAAGTSASWVGNQAVIPTNGGSFDVYVTDNTWVVIDVNGYYISPSALSLGTGTAAAPSLSFTGDSTSGIYSTGAPSNTTINVATGGTNRLTVSSSGIDVAGDINLNGAVRYQGDKVLAFPGGNQNTAVGLNALSLNTGNFNTGVGQQALTNNTSGKNNTAIGSQVMQSNDIGVSNTAVGDGALQSNTSGSWNVAVGPGALNSNSTGGFNIAIGPSAAGNVAPTNSNNIHIGSQGASGDSGTIRIGSAQTAFFAAGIRGATTGSGDAVAVVVDSNGQLGTVSSSRRFKEDIQDMGDATRGLMHLRPVTFRYQKPFADGSKPIQYGLIAEEVAEVYPDLVAHSADGKIETVKYQVLDSMLLNEVQRQQRVIDQQQREIELLKTQLNGLPDLESRLVMLENKTAGLH